MNSINTHNLKVEFGRHKGELYTRVPVAYLKWMVQAKHDQAHIAQAELDRRGTVTPDVDITGHAIDRASLRCRKIWHQSRGENEGLHAWLVRMSREALASYSGNGDGKIEYGGLKMAFEFEGAWPVLKTVVPAKQKERSEPPKISHNTPLCNIGNVT